MTTKNKSFRFNLDEQEYSLLEKEAEKRGISMAGVLRQYIRTLSSGKQGSDHG